MARKVCDPGCPQVEIASTTFLKHGQCARRVTALAFTAFYSDFLLLFRSQNLENYTSLDSLRCVVYFYNRLKVICATNKHLERDKC